MRTGRTIIKGPKRDRDLEALSRSEVHRHHEWWLVGQLKSNVALPLKPDQRQRARLVSAIVHADRLHRLISCTNHIVKGDGRDHDIVLPCCGIFAIGLFAICFGCSAVAISGLTADHGRGSSLLGTGDDRRAATVVRLLGRWASWRGEGRGTAVVLLIQQWCSSMGEDRGTADVRVNPSRGANLVLRTVDGLLGGGGWRLIGGARETAVMLLAHRWCSCWGEDRGAADLRPGQWSCLRGGDRGTTELSLVFRWSSLKGEYSGTAFVLLFHQWCSLRGNNSETACRRQGSSSGGKNRGTTDYHGRNHKVRGTADGLLLKLIGEYLGTAVVRLADKGSSLTAKYWGTAVTAKNWGTSVVLLAG